MKTQQEENQFLQTEQHVYGARLKAARILLSVSAVDLAAEADLSASKISRIENSADPYTIADDELTRLSLALGVSRQWLLTPPSANLSTGSLHFRKNSRMNTSHVQAVMAWEMLMAELVNVLNPKVRFIPVNLPVVDLTQCSPEDAAMLTRQALGINARMPIDHIIRAAEKLGVFVETHDFDEQLHFKNHDASSTWASLASGASAPMIMCRTHSSWERTRFSVAHELGHLVMHRHGGGKHKEEEANRFASELIFPAQTMWEEIERPVTLASLLPLKLKWGMSLQALIMGCVRAGIINDARKTSLLKQLSARRNSDTGESWRTREPGADDRRVERPMLLGAVIAKAYGKPPKVDDLLTDLPIEHHNWFKSLLINFDLQWSKDINTEMKLEAAEQQLKADKSENVILFSSYQQNR